MRRGWISFQRLAQLFLLFLLSLVSGCGSSFSVSGALNAPNMSVATGTVSFVQFTAIFDNSGTLVNVTVVTLTTPPMLNTFTFCGNQVSQFTMNSAVQVSFTSGTPTCSNLVSVMAR